MSSLHFLQSKSVKILIMSLNKLLHIKSRQKSFDKNTTKTKWKTPQTELEIYMSNTKNNHARCQSSLYFPSNIILTGDIK